MDSDREFSLLQRKWDPPDADFRFPNVTTVDRLIPERLAEFNLFRDRVKVIPRFNGDEVFRSELVRRANSSNRDLPVE